MKILAFSDVHANLNYLREIYGKSQKENPDIIICAGDVLNFWNYSGEIKRSLEKLNKLILLIHGNHEDPKLIGRLCGKNVINIHKKIFTFNKINFLGYGGGGFAKEDRNMENFFDKIKNRLNKFVFITHAPPFNTKTDIVLNHHVGSKSIRKIIEKFNPLLNICGHLHENFYVGDKINRTEIINPGPSGTIINL